MALKCTKIENCDLSLGGKTFNKCERCLDGYALNSNRSSCQQHKVANCFETAAEGVGDVCLVCNPNYLISSDGRFCNEFRMNNCLLQSTFQKTTPSPSASASQDLLSYDSLVGAGCQVCEQGYVATRYKPVQKVCVYSQRLASNGIAPGSFGVTNCQLYSGNVNCTQCKPGFMLAEHNDTAKFYDMCVPSDVAPNCAKVTYTFTDSCACLQPNTNQGCFSCQVQSYYCVKCSPGFFLQNNKCVDGRLYIPSCLEFQPLVAVAPGQPVTDF